MTDTPAPTCVGCGKTPAELPEYIEMAKEYDTTPDRYVRAEEGTYNPVNGHFACDTCYIRMGMPAGRHGQRWTAP